MAARIVMEPSGSSWRLTFTWYLLSSFSWISGAPALVMSSTWIWAAKRSEKRRHFLHALQLLRRIATELVEPSLRSFALPRQDAS